METLPYAKREPRFREFPTPEPYEMFGQVVFHNSLNSMNNPDRQIQKGNLRQIFMKTNAKFIDSRIDEIDRNRANLLHDSKGVQLKQTKIPPPLERPTRYQRTPYSYSTQWISHPSPSSSLSAMPSETYCTTYSSSPISAMDLTKRSKSSQSRYDSIKYHEKYMKTLVDQIDKEIETKDQANIDDIRKQRNRYLLSLELRNRLEKVHFFQ